MIAEMQEQRISHTGHTGVNSNDGRFEHANANDHMLHNPNQESDPNKGTLLFPPPPRSVFEGKPNNNLIQCLSLFSPTALRACVCVCVCVCVSCVCFLCSLVCGFPCVFHRVYCMECCLSIVQCCVSHHRCCLLWTMLYPIQSTHQQTKKPISPYLTFIFIFPPAFTDANPLSGSENRYEHPNPNLTSNPTNEEHGTQYVIPEDWNRHKEDSGMPKGELIRRGKRSYDIKHSYRKVDYLKGGRKEEVFRPEQGMHTTKFSSGFMRRQNGEPNREQNSTKQIERLEARERRRDFRKSELATVFRVGCGNGVLTGEYGPGYKVPPPQRSRGRKHFNQVLSDQSILEGEMKLRQSSSRFYTELSDEVREQRGKAITREGLETEKQSSVLGIGRAELKSYGASDNFSNSLYLAADKKSLAASRPPMQKRGTARQEAARNAEIAMVKSLGR